MTQDQTKKPKYDFQKMKSGATSTNPQVRKKAFQEYFERFSEFPSYLFDNSTTINDLLLETIRDIKNDPMTSEQMQKGIASLLERLPSTSEVI